MTHKRNFYHPFPETVWIIIATNVHMDCWFYIWKCTCKKHVNAITHLLPHVQSSLEQQVKDLSGRLEEEVTNATKAAKREAAKLQARVYS